MKKILNRITDFIGNTPLVDLSRLTNGKGRLLAKMEFIQPGGSIKDRAALQIIKDAYANGKLIKGQLVVEMTSGNMGAGLAVVCGAMGNPFTAVMSEGNSPERLRILKALGAEIAQVPQVDGTLGKVTGKDIQRATERAIELAGERNAFYVDQFNNPSSVTAHYTTTGPEIWEQLEGKPDAFLAGIGSSGTFTGTSRFLKEKNPSIFCAAMEPASAAILKTGKVENPKHIIQGTGYSLIPPHWAPSLADAIITVTDDETREQARQLHRDFGLYVGYSAAANVYAALELIKNYFPRPNPLVVTVLCDTAYKYSDL